MTEKHRMSEAARAKPFLLGDIEWLMESIAPAIREAIEAAVKPVEARVAAIEEGGIKFLGVYQRAQTYQRGAVVTHGGAWFVAIRAVAVDEQPLKSDGWQLAVKSGRDGRDGRDAR